VRVRNCPTPGSLYGPNMLQIWFKKKQEASASLPSQARRRIK
jgi:hypothetical protein